MTLGYVRSDGRQFSLSPRVLDLGYAYLSSLSLPRSPSRTWRRLVARSTSRRRCPCSTATTSSTSPGYRSRRIMTVAISVGTRFPAYATSMGRVLLAGLPDDELDAYLAKVRLERLTGRTVTSPVGAARRTAPDPGPGLGPGRPGARGRAAGRRRADQGPQRPHDRRPQRVGRRLPHAARGDPAHVRAGAGGHRRPDRGRSAPLSPRYFMVTASERPISGMIGGTFS